ncbi:MAG: GNAT family N-acetyltransferase [Chloroflexi bacterium]|nr:GNAT family N-acetyltransferase [Chloroflexota bacterium]
MGHPRLTFIDGTPEHFEAIIGMEREVGGSSLVVLTEGLALDEALRRGHYNINALADGEVAGWIWFSVDGARGGEDVGQVFRVAVARAHLRTGVGGALVEHAHAILARRQCTRVRFTLPGDDGATRAFLAELGYAVDAVIMERLL